MSAALFEKHEHEGLASHIREYAGSTVSQEDVLRLHVCQYVPHKRQEPLPSDAVTIIAAHANGYPKELYEPLWDELLLRADRCGFTIRGIWIADTANFGASGVLNEELLSSDSSWMDHSRDLLLLINQFRNQMPRPLVGIGHSFGGCQIVNLAYIHPRLFTSLILLDPIIQLNPPLMGLGSDPPGLLNFTVHANDVFPNLEAAAAHLARSPEFKRFDPRVSALMLKHGFRHLPTLLHPESPKGSDASDMPVTFTSTKHQNAWSQLRENFNARDHEGRLRTDRRDTHADLDPLAGFIPFYRPEPRSTWYRLPTLRPDALFLLAGKIFISVDELREGIKVAGTGVGGGGGAAQGKIVEDTVQNFGHLFPFEAPDATADKIACYLEGAMSRFREAEEKWRVERATRDRADDLRVNETWKTLIKPPSAFKKAPSKSKM